MLKRLATREEVERSWTFFDIMKANALLDYTEDLEALAAEKGDKP